MRQLQIYSGTSNPSFAHSVCEAAGVRLGNCQLSRFADGEIQVEIHESVRGNDVFVVQSCCPPVNENYMELFLVLDALSRASANSITAVLPYYGYARQDRRVRSARVAISAKVVADMIGAVGVDRVLTVDLHAEQIQGFFSIPVDNVYGSPVLTDEIERQKYQNLIVVSPDIGGVVRARAVAKQLEVDLAVIDKRRPSINGAQVMPIIGDVAGRACLIVDDLVDTAGTICKAADALKEAGAESVVAYCTHPVLSGNAIRNVEESKLDRLVVTDTIPLREEAQQSQRIRQLSMARLLAESIRRVSNEESISAMFDNT